MQANADSAFMERALALAARGRGLVAPNPLVGCVLVRDDEVVGEGWHAGPGTPHAEACALAEAGDRARGATAYITLEPCDHVGRTPPCSLALLEAGVARVVVAIADPNPLAAGGAERVRAAGIEVTFGVQAEAAARQNAVFLHAHQQGRPFVVLKAAVSLDGRIAAADGSSQWLTGEAARHRAHELRAGADAIVVGSGTVLADDPHLTVRLPDYAGRPPLRVVLDRRGRVRPPRRVLDDAAPTLVTGLDLDAVLKTLWERDVRSVLVEGGAHVASAFLAAGLVDRLVLHVAPLLLGSAGLPLLRGGPPTLAAAEHWRLDDSERAGDDAILTLIPER